MIGWMLAAAATTLNPQAGMRAWGSDSMAQMKGHRRVLLIAAPSWQDKALRAQLEVLRTWRGGGMRDVSPVQVIDGKVRGATDSAASLARTYRLDPRRFTVVLIGKDGHEALRSATPLTGAALEKTIDAMPMRQDER